MLSVLFNVSGYSVLLMVLWECIGCCCEWVPGWTRVEQWERTNILTYVRIVGNHLVFCLSARLGEGLCFLATNCLAQVRSPRLSESSRNPSGATVAVSPKRESTAWARALLSPERGLPAWARPSLGSCCASFHECCWLFDWLVHWFTL